MKRGPTRLLVEETVWPLRAPFRIHGYEWTRLEVITVTLEADGARGRGEGAPLFYRNETAGDLAHALEAVRPEIERGASREALADLPLPSGAKNALDCALWDLEAKQTGRPVWAMLGQGQPRPLRGLATVTLAAPEAMAEQARNLSQTPILKAKLGGPDDAACIKAIRAARPDAHLILDANCGWTFEGLREITPALADAGVEMIEQPLPPGEDDALNGYESPIPICADESCQTEASLAQLPSAYGMINIKLDKAGGLTAAYRLAAAARRRGLAVMVGNMLGSSLAMAPAFLLAQTSAYADLDGPIYLTEDCAHAMRYANGAVEPPRSELWG